MSNQAVAAVLYHHQTGLQNVNVSTVQNSGCFRVRNRSSPLWKFKDIQNCYCEKMVIHRFLQITWFDILGYKSGKSNLGGCENMDLAFTLFLEIWLWSEVCETTSRSFERRNKQQKYFILKSKRIYFSLTNRTAFGIEFFFRHHTRNE